MKIILFKREITSELISHTFPLFFNIYKDCNIYILYIYIIKSIINEIERKNS